MPETKYIKQGIRHCHILYNNGGVVAYKRAWLTDKCNITVSNAKLTYSGDATKFDVMYGYQCMGDIEVSADDDTIDSILFNTPVVSPQAGDDFVKRYIKGSYAELAANYVGLQVAIDARNADTGAVAVFRYHVLKCQFSPEAPPQFVSESVTGRKLSFNSYKASTNIVGTALTGMPSDGCFWMADILTDPTKFDIAADGAF